MYFQYLHTHFTKIIIIKHYSIKRTDAGLCVALIGREGDGKKHISDVDYIPSIIVLRYI